MEVFHLLIIRIASFWWEIIRRRKAGGETKQEVNGGEEIVTEKQLEEIEKEKMNKKAIGEQEKMPE